MIAVLSLFKFGSLKLIHDFQLLEVVVVEIVGDHVERFERRPEHFFIPVAAICHKLAGGCDNVAPCDL